MVSPKYFNYPLHEKYRSGSLVSFNTGVCQTTFNQQIDFGQFGFPFSTLTSVYPTDSCYYATGIVSDTSGGVFAFGTVFVKFDLHGEIMFFKKLTKPDRDYFSWQGDLVATHDGGFLDIGIVVDSVIRGVLIKYDTNGDTVFTMEYTNPLFPQEDFIYAAGLQALNNDTVAILFGVDSSIDPAPANGDIYLLYVDSLGNVLDSFMYGDATMQNPQNAVMDDGGVLITTSKTNTHLVDKNFSSQAHVFKVDATGNIQWEFLSPSGQLFDHATDVVKTPDGGIVLATGKGIEEMINSESGILKWFPYFMKLDASHDFEWGKEFRGGRPSSAFTMVKLVEATDGSGYVGVSRIGENVSVGEEVLGSWIVKATTEGDSAWARYYSFFDGINTRPVPYDLKNTPDGGYIICGETDPQNIGGAIDGAWLMKVDSFGCLIPGCHIVHTEELHEDVPHFAIHPNPTSDFLNFQLRGVIPKKGAQFRIINLQGHILKNMDVGYPGDTLIVPVSQWPAGIYLLQCVVDDNVVATGRFIKQ